MAIEQTALQKTIDLTNAVVAAASSDEPSVDDSFEQFDDELPELEDLDEQEPQDLSDSEPDKAEAESLAAISDEILSPEQFKQDFLGYQNARELIANGGVQALMNTVAARRSQLVSQFQEQNQNQRASQSNGSRQSQIQEGFRLLADKLLNPKHEPAEVFQRHMESRNEQLFVQSLEVAENIAKEWRIRSAEVSDFESSEFAKELEAKMNQAVDSVERLGKLKTKGLLNGGVDPDLVITTTAEQIASFTEKNKDVLSKMQANNMSMLERFDQVTNSFFTMVKDLIARVLGMGKQSSQSTQRMG